MCMNGVICIQYKCMYAFLTISPLQVDKIFVYKDIDSCQVAVKGALLMLLMIHFCLLL